MQIAKVSRKKLGYEEEREKSQRNGGKRRKESDRLGLRRKTP